MNEAIDNSATSASAPTTRLFTLRKGEKLRHRSLVNALFASGKSFYDFPLRLQVRALTPEELRHTFRDAPPRGIDSLQMLITVPKKKRRHAVDRVLMRRRIREAYRLHRLPLKESVESATDIGTLSMAFIYMAPENVAYAAVEAKMKRLLAKVQKYIESGQ